MTAGWRIARLASVAVLLLAACSGDDSAPSPAIGYSFPHSAALSTVEWHPESGNLWVWFAPGSHEDDRSSGKPYLYCGVPRAVYDGLVGARSPGRYFHEHIAERYDTAQFVADTTVEAEAGLEPVSHWTCER